MVLGKFRHQPDRRSSPSLVLPHRPPSIEDKCSYKTRLRLSFRPPDRLLLFRDVSRPSVESDCFDFDVTLYEKTGRTFGSPSGSMLRSNPNPEPRNHAKVRPEFVSVNVEVTFISTITFYHVFRMVLAVALFYLSLIHIHRQIYDYGSYNLDITGE